ncbi:TetR/AcrR family transcriptional regulator [Actinomadura macrotermitis]|uniref:HTH-type transcriptional repressor ComR n=1 Tax=Actinomadura macrotermitis TaxID=2585200 RepID=A0A7K0BZW8_9ACTN|nr:TetR/AcrR family transcriptional regulator [Actinomadura macrotermitis]MQY06721.1 HTH-type transcriptional repressor ComR [Actinomadura macrotermitis]
MGRAKQFDPDVAVERAMQVFWRKGYGATSPQDLVDALGIGKGSLYNAFGSKHALFELALRRYRDEQAVQLIELLERPGPVPVRLREALELLVRMDLDDPDRKGCMAVNAAAELGGVDQVATDLVRRMLERTESAFQALVEEGQRSGQIDPGRDARKLASLLLTTMIGMRLTARTADGPDRLNRVVDALLDSL